MDKKIMRTIASNATAQLQEIFALAEALPEGVTASTTQEKLRLAHKHLKSIKQAAELAELAIRIMMVK